MVLVFPISHDLSNHTIKASIYSLSLGTTEIADVCYPTLFPSGEVDEHETTACFTTFGTINSVRQAIGHGY